MKKWTGIVLAGLAGLIWAPPDAQAMSQWARKYGVSCTVCHTTVPRLTPVGYKFRAAGFRMPDEIGQDAKFNGLKDLYAVRIREEFRVKNNNSDNTSTAFAFHELTFYPISGAIGKWWAAESELTFVPDEKPEVENAYVRAAVPKGDDWLLTARAGIFHPYEGYGASDRSISNYRPLLLTGQAQHGSFKSPVKVFGQDQEGLEVGASYKDARLTAAILNGFNTAGGGANVGEDNQLRDILVFYNQILGDRSGVSAEILNGYTDHDLTGAAGKEWTNNYLRTNVFGHYDVAKRLTLLAGAGVGQDHFPDPGGFVYSKSWFATAESNLHEHFTGQLRYDKFTPSAARSDVRKEAITLTGAIPFDNVKFLVDYQYARSLAPATPDAVEHNVRLEWMVIY